MECSVLQAPGWVTAISKLWEEKVNKAPHPVQLWNCCMSWIQRAPVWLYQHLTQNPTLWELFDCAFDSINRHHELCVGGLIGQGKGSTFWSFDDLSAPNTLCRALHLRCKFCERKEIWGEGTPFFRSHARTTKGLRFSKVRQPVLSFFCCRHPPHFCRPCDTFPPTFNKATRSSSWRNESFCLCFVNPWCKM